MGVDVLCGKCGFANSRSFRGCVRCGASLSDDELELPWVGAPELRSALTEAVSDVHDIRESRLLYLDAKYGGGKSRTLTFLAELWANKFGDDARILCATAREGDDRFAPFPRLLLERFGVAPSQSPNAVRAQILSSLSEALAGQSASIVTEAAHVLGHLAGIPFPASPVLEPLLKNPELLRERTRRALSMLLESWLEKTPLLVLFDGLNGSHLDTLQVLRELTDGKHAVLIAVASESDLHTLRAPHPRVRRVPLLAWSENEVRQAADAMLARGIAGEGLGGLVLPDSFVLALTHRSGGHPAAVRELMFAMVESGAFRQIESLDLEGSGNTLAMPLTVEDAFRARLARLGVHERNALERAAVLGTTIWDRAILAMERSETRSAEAFNENQWPSSRDEEVLDQTLSSLLARGLLELLPDLSSELLTANRFTNVEFREFLYAQTADDKKRARHAVVAHWITVIFEIRGEGIASMTAPHFEKAGMSRRAARAYLEAAREDQQVGNTEAAGRHVDKAIELLPSDEVARKLDALHLRGAVSVTQGDLEKGLLSFSAMLGLAYSLDARSKGAAALNRIARIYRTQGDDRKAQGVFLRALELFRDCSDLRGVASCLDDLAQVARHRGDLIEAVRHAKEALTIREGLHDPRAEAVSFQTLGAIELTRGDVVSARAHLDRALVLREESGDLSGSAETLNTLGSLAVTVGDVVNADVYFKRALVLAHKSSDLRMLVFLNNNLGELEIARRDYAAADAHLREGESLARHLGEKRARADILRNQAVLALRTGSPEASALMESALQAASDYGGILPRALAHRALAEAGAETLFDAGSETSSEETNDHAHDHFRAAIALFRELGNPREAALCLAALGRYLLERGDRASAKSTLSEAESLLTSPTNRFAFDEVRALLRTL